MDLRTECDEIGRLAIAHAPVAHREIFSALFALDHRLSRIAAAAREPMLAQMRLAWWRDRLKEDTSERPQGDPVLDAIARCWTGEEQALTSLVDGWEEALAGAPVGEGILALGQGRGAAFAATARLCGRRDYAPAVGRHGNLWAATTLIAQNPDDETLATWQTNARPQLPRLPRNLRSIAIIGGLSRRVLLKGGGPILGDRLSPLAALRLGIFGH